MTVMKWMSCIVPILEFVGRAHGQAIRADSGPTAGRRPVYSRRPGDDSVLGAALRNGDSDAGAD